MTEPVTSALHPESDPRDLITQLQTCLDQMNTQFFASLQHVATRHPLSAPIDPFALQPPSSSSSAAAPAASPATIANGGPGSQSTQQSSRPALSQSQSQTGTSQQTQTPQSLQSQPQPQLQPSTRTSHSQHFPYFLDPLDNPTDPNSERAAKDMANAKDKDKDGPEDREPISPNFQPLPLPEFRDQVRELAQDLVSKQKQIELLVGHLPPDAGEGGEKTRQETRLRELERELEGLRRQLGGARERKEKMLSQVDNIMGAWTNGKV